jgi:hypothetical protein
MTDEQIMQIASSYLRELWAGDIGDAVWQPLEEDALLKFAREMLSAGYCERKKDEENLLSTSLED